MHIQWNTYYLEEHMAEQCVPNLYSQPLGKERNNEKTWLSSKSDSKPLRVICGWRLQTTQPDDIGNIRAP